MSHVYGLSGSIIILMGLIITIFSSKFDWVHSLMMAALLASQVLIYILSVRLGE